jgi:hypothetical protein
MAKSQYQFGREPRPGEKVILTLTKLNHLIDVADIALDGDSNDAEHDALYYIREALANLSQDPNARRD